MHWSQFAYIAALGLALWAGRPARVVVFVMVGNFLAGAFLAADPLDVALVDIGSAVILIGYDVRRNIVAAVFCLMVVMAVAGDAIGLSRAQIYTMVDLLAVVQLLVIGRADGGLRRLGGSLRSSFNGRPDTVHNHLASRDYPPEGNRVSAENVRRRS